TSWTQSEFLHGFSPVWKNGLMIFENVSRKFTQIDTNQPDDCHSNCDNSQSQAGLPLFQEKFPEKVRNLSS
ncbi:MAG: hypothetical protein LBQ54_14605, partial [Planctomycetaceae bacterium]|nr:hypothetical protein [Planctomycetaceae bacterium]